MWSFNRNAIAISISIVFLSLALPASAQQNPELFQGKEISVLIGGASGGGQDNYARLFARHLGRLVPGAPSIVARNVLGAGGLKLANQLYNISPRDGTELGTFLTSTALEPLFGNKEARFETAKFTWIGNMLDSDATACVTWRTSGLKTWEDLKGRETAFGASGASSLTSVQTKIAGEILGVNTKVISGYQGGLRETNLAMQRGELDATCGIYIGTLQSQFSDQIQTGDLILWMTFGARRDAAFPNVPTIYEVIRSDTDRELAKLIFEQDVLSRPIAAPPGLSQERTVTLRAAFMATMADKEFLEEANKMRLKISAMDGQETAKRYQSFYEILPAAIERAKKIIGRPSE